MRNHHAAFLLIGVFILVLMGQVMRVGMNDAGAPTAYAAFFALILGGGTMILIARSDPRTWVRHAPAFLAVVVALLLLLFVPGVGGRVGGRLQFLVIGPFALRPAALAGIALIGFLSVWKPERAGERKTATGLLLITACALVAGIVAQIPDFTAALIVLFAGAVVLVSRRYFASAAMLVAGSFMAGLLVIMNHPPRVARLLAYFGSAVGARSIPLPRLAIERGGVLGVGLGNGETFAPYPGAAREFVAAHIAEELGLVAVLAIATAVCFIVLAGAGIGRSATSPALRHLSRGIAALIALPALAHLLVCFGWLPLRAAALPFVNSGMTDLLVLFGLAGLLLAVNRDVSAAGGGDPAAEPAWDGSPPGSVT